MAKQYVPSPASIAGRRLGAECLLLRERKVVLRGLDVERNVLVEQWTGLVKLILRRYSLWARRHNGPVDDDDAVSTGYVGLIRAAENFDPSRGVKFSTYAGRAIWSQIQYMWEGVGLIKVRPPRYKDRLKQLRAEGCVRSVRYLKSLNNPELCEKFTELDSRFEELELRDWAEELISSSALKPNQLKVLRRHLWGGEDFAVAGRGMGLTREAVRQSYAKAIGVLRAKAGVG